MIKVKVYTEEEWLKTIPAGSSRENNRVVDPETHFEYLLARNKLGQKKGPFRDAESIRLLKEYDNITFADDRDWYSVIWWEDRIPISCLNREIKYALAIVDASREGLYSWLFEPRFPYIGENIWKILADLSFDIRIAVKIREMGIRREGCFIEGAEYQIINYPYKNQRIQVTVKNRGMTVMDDDFYVGVPEYRVRGTGYGLYKGKDGEYYSERLLINDAFQYYWRNDIIGVIEYIEKNYSKRQRLADVSQVYFRDGCEIISYLSIAPSDVWPRKTPVMIVDKNRDGSYRITEELTVKYPELRECVEAAILHRSPERDRFMLVIEVMEILSSVKDIDKAVYGFRVQEDSLEIFDKYEAVQMFGRALKEAHRSGRYRID